MNLIRDENGKALLVEIGSNELESQIEKAWELYYRCEKSDDLWPSDAEVTKQVDELDSFATLIHMAAVELRKRT